MNISPLDSTIFAGYFSDDELGALFSDGQRIRQLMHVEAALAAAQAKLGMIPEQAAEEIGQVLSETEIDAADLKESVTANGVPTIALVKLLRSKLSEETRPYLHYGATSQDIIDTALACDISDANGILRTKIERLISLLIQHIDDHRHVLTLSRTRSQQALPMPYALKVTHWLQPLIRHLDRLFESSGRLLQVQLGGAGGTMASYGSRGKELTDQFAEELGLLSGTGHWQSQRDNIAEYGSILAMIIGSLGKMASDIRYMAYSEVGEFIEDAVGDGGQSSAMPHKSNPVLSEAVLSLASYAMGLSHNLNSAIVHSNERDGHTWSLEWLSLPQMIVATGAALNHASSIIEKGRVNTDRMKQNLDATNGLCMSEAAKQLLSGKMNAGEAARILGEACRKCLDENSHLAEALTSLVPESGINWKEALEPGNYIGNAHEVIDQVLEEAREMTE